MLCSHMSPAHFGKLNETRVVSPLVFCQHVVLQELGETSNGTFWITLSDLVNGSWPRYGKRCKHSSSPQPFLIQAAWLPHKTMVRVRLVVALCAVKSIPSYSVVSALKSFCKISCQHLLGNCLSGTVDVTCLCMGTFVVCSAGMVLGLIWLAGWQVSSLFFRQISD